MVELLVLLVVVIIIAVWITPRSCDAYDYEGKTHTALENAGYESPKILGRAYFKCSQDDLVGYSFTALNPSNRIVTGTVCCGVLKGCTVRF